MCSRVRPENSIPSKAKSEPYLRRFSKGWSFYERATITSGRFSRRVDAEPLFMTAHSTALATEHAMVAAILSTRQFS